MGGPSIEPDHTIKHSAEYKSLTTHLSSKPQPLGTALDSFCGPTEDLFMQSKATSEIEAQLWHAWKAIIAAATQTPHDSAGRQKLTDFVLALRDRPVLERNGKVCKVWDATVWKELPVFGAAMREAWNAAATDHSHHHARSAWINLNAFAATLVATQHSGAAPPASSDFSLYAIWTIRMALEDSAPSPASDKTSQAAAAAWLAYAAPALWAMSREGKEFDGKMAKQGQAMEGKEWRGFNEERWGVWEEGLGACEGDGLVGKAREAVRGCKSA